MLRALLLLPIVLALPACKKKPSDDSMARFAELSDKMCSCKDTACAEKVESELSSVSKGLTAHPAKSEADMKKLDEIGTKYGDCKAKLMGPTDAPGGSSPSTTNDKLTNADQILKRAYELVPARHMVKDVTLSYVRADGTVDPTYGSVEVRLGNARKPTDPDEDSRPIGAPVLPKPAVVENYPERCPTYTWKQGVRADSDTWCMSPRSGIRRPTCSVVEVWKRAIGAGAPAAGLAVLTLHEPRPGSQSQYWHFAIDDGPRKIHFSHSVWDACEPTLEKP